MDKLSTEIIEMANNVIAQGGDVWVKWTCPGCGDRCIADDKNTFHRGGYKHDKCGTWYRGDLYGMMVAYIDGSKIYGI